jgi:hypothetical protein
MWPQTALHGSPAPRRIVESLLVFDFLIPDFSITLGNARPRAIQPCRRFEQSPAGHFGLWVIKILAATLGETGGDALSMTLALGYGVSTAIFFGLFVVTIDS